MNKSKFYGNIVDISEIPEPLLKLVMSEWFDKNDIIVDKERIDSDYVRIIGNDINQIRARKDVRNGGGVRIKEVKR